MFCILYTVYAIVKLEGIQVYNILLYINIHIHYIHTVYVYCILYYIYLYIL